MQILISHSRVLSSQFNIRLMSMLIDVNSTRDRRPYVSVLTGLIDKPRVRCRAIWLELKQWLLVCGPAFVDYEGDPASDGRVESRTRRWKTNRSSLQLIFRVVPPGMIFVVVYRANICQIRDLVIPPHSMCFATKGR